VLAFSGLHPELRPWADALLRVAATYGLQVVVTSVRRSRSQQAALYARYLRGESSLPAAPPGTSDHEYGLAFDLVVNGNWNGPEQAWLGAVWRHWGGAWSERDRVHFFVT
jgi:peptidoglycan LD-endopeptidase CwlK